jgi:hypothetical protein
MIEPDVTAEERDALIDQVAERIARWGLDVLAVLFLEMHRPLSFLAGQSLLVAMPFLGAFVDSRHLTRWSRLLQSPENIDRLIERIDAPRGQAKAVGGADDAAR